MAGGPVIGKSNSLMNEYSSLLGDAILRQRARTAEQTARIEASLASRVKSEFLSNMSHELRTPLNTVIGFSKILCEHARRPLPDEEIIEYANLIHDSAGHLLAVINDILDMSKIQSGRYTLDAREVALDEVLAVAMATFESAAVDAKVALHHTIAADLPPVRGDAGKLRQIFANLLGNAIKFTRQGGNVRVEAFRVADGGVVVAIRDTGVGMSQEEIEVALTPFGQVDGSRTRWREGTGLGLPIAKAMTEPHGGRLEINSEKDVGTEVLVYLPSRNAVTALSDVDDMVSPAPAAVPATPRLQGETRP